ncbi:MAG: hypothetical protein ACM3KR_05585 [Deltaproteobacteria bacterium]
MKGIKERRLRKFAQKKGLQIKNVTGSNEVEKRMIKFALPAAKILEIASKGGKQFVIYWKGIKFILIKNKANKWQLSIFSPFKINLAEKKSKTFETPENLTDWDLTLILMGINQTRVNPLSWLLY